MLTKSTHDSFLAKKDVDHSDIFFPGVVLFISLVLRRSGFGSNILAKVATKKIVQNRNNESSLKFVSIVDNNPLSQSVRPSVSFSWDLPGLRCTGGLLRMTLYTFLSPDIIILNRLHRGLKRISRKQKTGIPR